MSWIVPWEPQKIIIVFVKKIIMSKSSIKSKLYFPFKEDWDLVPVDNEVKERSGRKKWDS